MMRTVLHFRLEGSATAVILLALSSCQPGAAKAPWSGSASDHPASHAEVRTLNSDYKRTKSEVLVREITRPTRANLDYAAYHQNFMIATPAPEDVGGAPNNAPIDTAKPFRGLIEKASLTADFTALPLSEAERAHPLAFPPLVELLASKKIAENEKLRDLASAVRDESWGLPHRPGLATQTLTEVYVHAGTSGAELYAKVEFEPWFHDLGALPDQDGDGYPEVYGKVPSGSLSSDAATFIRDDYQGHELSASEVKGWANQLSSYWYPSFNTDLVPPGPVFPDANTEADIKAQLHGQSFPSPAIVLRGKPQGKPTYQVFLISTASSANASAAKAPSAAIKLAKTAVSPNPAPVATAIQRELAEHGNSWDKWLAEVAPYRAEVKRRLNAMPKQTKAVAGENGFLFFRNSLEYVTSGDIAAQRPGKNPLPIIVEFQKTLAASGVDFLFVPVPTKEELFPDALQSKLSDLKGKVVHPQGRKFLLELAKAGVEVVDLLPPFLAERGKDSASSEPLYQLQDTHWTDRGLRIAASIVAERVKHYPWYAELGRHARRFSSREAKFERFGDLHSRLPENKKGAYKPEALRGEQVVTAEGALYEDDADSPIVVLGDSYTGVYELMDCEHAGVSAHIAKDVGYPVDLVMSYGGGPNVRNKLLRRGADALRQKKLVIWMMTARDLYNYWEDWEPLQRDAH